MGDILVIAPFTVVLLLLGGSVMMYTSQRRLIDTYKRSYEQADLRADEWEKRVDRLLATCETRADLCRRLTNTCNEWEQINARNERTIADLMETVRHQREFMERLGTTN